ncbi:FUSC family protein [Beijerinckia indica]|uniref:Fusaric acid resistance protein conserved region n=1 Tax=Beijerinckia indica subsp. indica (strain ATCC 9039 / DSM 1715 / NCIMB 8712) TaxID=395963 RepID=B2IBS0_BEII9|nr:FUSC family protein [Beijerinckia indica]ACB93792.1 Fusaric acid resistance protein conserved region [Beijerinckia indica subsp. indica ATCC 9039]
MTLPNSRDWIFSVKTFAAALLALYIALMFDLPRPYWAMATVYITSQMLAGATRAKAAYRIAGTFCGAAVTILLIPNLVNAPLLLCLAIALWVSFCLYCSLLDRTPRSYLFILSGYTAALIGFPAVEEPGTIFDIAVSRAEEISIGIICASLMSVVILPRTVGEVVADRIEEWCAEADQLVLKICGTEGLEQLHTTFLRLAGGVLALEVFLKQIAYEASIKRHSVEALAILRQHMLVLLPIASGISDRIRILKHLSAFPTEADHLIADLRKWLQGDDTSAVSPMILRATAEAAKPAPTKDWNTLLSLSLIAQIEHFIDLQEDIRRLKKHVINGTRLPELKCPYIRSTLNIRHRDHTLAFRSALSAFVSILVTCGFWILTGWSNDGSGAPMMAAVACCFFATMDDPAPAILKFANSTIIGALWTAIYLFALLPRVTNFEMLALMLAPALLLCGALMHHPKTALSAMGAAVIGLTLLALHSAYGADFAVFVNSAFAVTSGMWIAAIVTRLIRSVDETWTARRLVNLNRSMLVEVADGHRRRGGFEIAALMLDRLGLISTRLKTARIAEELQPEVFLAEIRAAINIAEIKQARRRQPEAIRRAIDRILNAAIGHFGGQVHMKTRTLLEEIDAGLTIIPVDEEQDLCARLVGLRVALFPDALPYAPPSERIQDKNNPLLLEPVQRP